MTIYAPTSIDLSRVPPQDAIETVAFDTMLAAALDRHQVEWDAQRIKDPTLPEYTVSMIAADPAVIALRTWTFLRTFDRQRVNDALNALIAIRAKSGDLDNLVASRNLARLVLVPQTATAAAITETDANLLRRYLLSFDRASAGSRDRYLFEAWTAWPGAGDIRVNGFAVHGRRGDIDIVVSGPGGRDATLDEQALVRAAVTAPHAVPEGVSITVLKAIRHTYAAHLVIDVPSGPDPDLVAQEALLRVRAAADARTLIGGEVPLGQPAGAAYGPSIIKVSGGPAQAIAADPYAVPVLTDITITPVVRT